MPSLAHELPQPCPPCVLVPVSEEQEENLFAISTGANQETNQDGSVFSSMSDDFNKSVAAHVNLLFSKLIAEHQASFAKLIMQHQSRVCFMQSQIDYLHEKLGTEIERQRPERTPSGDIVANERPLDCRIEANATERQNSALSNASSATLGRKVSFSDKEMPEIVDGSPKHVDSEYPSEASRKTSPNKHPDANYFSSEASRNTSWGDRFRKASSNSGILKKMKSIQYTPSVHQIDQKPLLQRMVLSNRFEILTGCIIIANTTVMACQLQYNGYEIGYDLKLKSYIAADEEWPGAVEVFRILDYMFNGCFALELLLRAYANRLRSFRKGWMWFDTVIITLGFLDLLAHDALGFDPTLVRLVRLVRLIRLLKIFKAMESFDSLFLLMKAIHASCSALFWSFLLLMCVQICAALFLCQTLNSFMTDTSKDPKVRGQVFIYFGTFSRAMVTMFEITLANWVPTCRLLMEEVHMAFFVFYLFYRCMFCFSVLRVIAAVFIAETNRVLAGDVELTLLKAKKERLAYKAKLRHVFADIDRYGHGTISWDDMQRFLSDSDMSAWLAMVGFSASDFEKLFWLIEVKGKVDTEKFLGMVDQLKGQAKTVDLLTLFKVMHTIDKKLSKLSASASDSAAHVNQVVTKFDKDEQEEELEEGHKLSQHDVHKVFGCSHSQPQL